MKRLQPHNLTIWRFVEDGRRSLPTVQAPRSSQCLRYRVRCPSRIARECREVSWVSREPRIFQRCTCSLHRRSSLPNPPGLLGFVAPRSRSPSWRTTKDCRRWQANARRSPLDSCRRTRSSSHCRDDEDTANLVRTTVTATTRSDCPRYCSRPSLICLVKVPRHLQSKAVFLIGSALKTLIYIYVRRLVKYGHCYDNHISSDVCATSRVLRGDIGIRDDNDKVNC